jgi:dTDP-4-dehydrorhamnose 3,5-epimerase-like enzyme
LSPPVDRFFTLTGGDIFFPQKHKNFSLKTMTERMSDPMNRFSFPTRAEDTLLGKKFQFDPRENPEKPGRSLRVIFDMRFPFVEDFSPEYIYSVTFDKSGSQAGNHYHRLKNEIFYPIKGKFEVHLESIEDLGKEVLNLNSENHEALFVKTGIAHKVVAKSSGAILLVVANAPNIESDEFPYFPTS